jgi:hypothetical protein
MRMRPILAGAMCLGLLAPTPALAQRLDRSDPPVAPAASTDQVIVTFRPSTGAAERARAVAAAGAVASRAVPALGPHTQVVRVRDVAASLRALKGRSSIVGAEPDVRRSGSRTPNDPYFGWQEPLAPYAGQTVHRWMRSESAWDRTVGSTGITVAVIDSGVAPHPGIVPNLLPGRDITNTAAPWSDSVNHGTPIAGVLGAVGDDAKDVAGFCWTCKVLPVKITRDSTGWAYDSDMAAGIRWAADQGARVINLSFAGPSSSNTLASAVQYAQGKGAVVVAAAGNDGTAAVNYPAGFPGVIAVGWSRGWATPDLRLGSNFGPWVDVAAPTSTTLENAPDGGTWGVQLVGGTSLATPAVVGTIALMLSVDPSLSVESITSTLCETAIPLTGTYSAGAYADHQVRCGQVDAGAAVARVAGAAAAPAPAPEPTPAPTSEPTPEPTVAPEPSPTPAPTPEPTVTSSPSPAPTTTVTTFSGSLNAKVRERSHVMTAGFGIVAATATFGKKCRALTVRATDSAGNSTSLSVPTGGRLEVWHTGGALTWTVSGCSTSYVLSVSHTV